MSEIKPVSFNEPVYQASESGASWYEIDASLYETYKTQDWIQIRILYPAAAYEALKAENEALRKQVDDHEEWHMMRDEMRKALEAQMNGDSK